MEERRWLVVELRGERERSECRERGRKSNNEGLSTLSNIYKLNLMIQELKTRQYNNKKKKSAKH